MELQLKMPEPELEKLRQSIEEIGYSLKVSLPATTMPIPDASIFARILDCNGKVLMNWYVIDDVELQITRAKQEREQAIKNLERIFANEEPTSVVKFGELLKPFIVDTSQFQALPTGNLSTNHYRHGTKERGTTNRGYQLRQASTRRRV